jgi:hypothetical protein
LRAPSSWSCPLVMRSACASSRKGTASVTRMRMSSLRTVALPPRSRAVRVHPEAIARHATEAHRSPKLKRPISSDRADLKETPQFLSLVRNGRCPWVMSDRSGGIRRADNGNWTHTHRDRPDF